MKLLLSLAILFGSIAVQAKCICQRYQGYESVCDSYGENCYNNSPVSFYALAIVGGKEYQLAKYDDRADCVKFITTAPECK